VLPNCADLFAQSRVPIVPGGVAVACSVQHAAIGPPLRVVRVDFDSTDHWRRVEMEVELPGKLAML